MARTIPAAIDATLDDSFVVPVFFIELVLDTDPVYAHTDLGPIVTMGQTWIGTTGLSQISQIEETKETKAPSFQIRMALTDEAAGTIFEEITQQDFYLRPVVVYFSTRNSLTGQLTADPFELYRGKLDVPTITHGGAQGDSFVQLLVESEWADGRLKNAQMYSDAQLRQEYADDEGFKFLADMINTKITWGSERRVNIGTPTPPVVDPNNPLPPGFTLPF